MELRVGDVKQYFYCPRIIYYTYCLPVPRPVTHPMQVGATEHEVLSVLERRRSLKRYGLNDGERRFHVPFRASSLGLTGVLDMLIITGERAFPVEFKHTVQRKLCVIGSIFIHFYQIDFLPLVNTIQTPGKMLQVNPVHCQAWAHMRVQRNDLLIRML